MLIRSIFRNPQNTWEMFRLRGCLYDSIFPTPNGMVIFRRGPHNGGVECKGGGRPVIVWDLRKQINANKSPKIAYSSAVKKMRKWSGIHAQIRITTKSQSLLEVHLVPVGIYTIRTTCWVMHNACACGSPVIWLVRLRTRGRVRNMR